MASDNRKNSHSLDEQQSRFKLTALARAVKAIGKRRQNSPHKQIKFESLEPRVLLSADPLSATLASNFGDDWSQQSETLELSTDALAYLSPVLESAGQETGWFRESVDPYGETLVLGRSLDELRVESGTNNWIVDESATQVQRHIAFVDSHVEGYESLLDNILPVANNEGGSVPVVEVVLLDADRDGVEQIAEYLANQQGISAIHVLAHGSEGSLSLGSAILDSESLDDYSAQLGGWGSALTVDADILLYGCNVASGEWGVEFVQNLAVLTGADVTASDDATGNAVLGGDWDLELQVGAIEALAIDEILDVRQLTGLLQDGVVLEKGTGIFSGYAKDDPIAGGNIDLRNVSNPLTWTIGADGQVTIESNDGSLTIKDVTILRAGTGQNDFIILNNAEFGSTSQAASIIGNGTSTTLSFTPNLANPDAFFTSNRVTSGINNVNLDSATDVINFGKVWFTAASITKVVGGKGNDVFEGKDAESSILVGGRGDDTLIGGSQPGDLLKGGVGDDTLIGGLGSDVLEGGGDDDHLYGALKDASLATPETGTDSLAGGEGDDTYHFLGNWGTDRVDERLGEGTDTLDFTALNAAVKVDVGVSIYNAEIGVRVSEPVAAASPENTAEASNVEVLELGEGANTIVVNDSYGATSTNKLTIKNAITTSQTVTGEATATLNLSNLTAGVQIKIEAFPYTTMVADAPVSNPNGNKVTVTFASGAKLIVFNVRNIDATSMDDTVTFEDGAVLDGALDLGNGKNEVILNGDVSKIFGPIFGGDGFDLLRIGSSVALLDSLTPADEATLVSISDIIKKVKGLGVADTLDLAAQYGVRLSTNPTDILSFDTLAFDGVVADSGGTTGVAIVAGDSQSFDVTTDAGKRDLLQGGSKDDILIGGPNDGDIKGGSGKDIIVSGSGDEILSGEAGADVYVFRDGWGNDSITRGFTESADNVLDFSLVTTDLTFVLRSSKVFVANGTDPGFKFDYDASEPAFVSADNTVTAERKILPLTTNTEVPGSKNSINTIKLSDSSTYTFEFGNDWNATTIDAPAGATLVLDFSRVYSELRFDFRQDGSLVVTKTGGINDVKDTLPGFIANASSIVINNVGVNTTVISGSRDNTYRVESGATFDGQLNLVGGPSKIRIPLTENHVPIPGDFLGRQLLGSVGHAIDMGQSIADEVGSFAGDIGATLTALKDAFSGDFSDAATKLKNVINNRTNTANLALNDATRDFLTDKAPFLKALVSEDLIPGIKNLNLLVGTELYVKDSGQNLSNRAEVNDVVLGGLSLNVAVGDLFVPPLPLITSGDSGSNVFTTKQGLPGIHVVSGLTGADEYEFKNLWGLALVLEIPDLDLGIPIPDATDKLDFSGVIGQEIIVDVYENPAAAGNDGSDFVQLLNDLGIGTDWLTGADSSNFVVARAVFEGVTVSSLVATDIESLVGPSALSTMTVRFHGNASLVGTVAPGFKGEVVLDYSDYAEKVETALDTVLLPTGDFGFENILLDQFFDKIGIEDPAAPSTTGSATGVAGNRFGGLTTILDIFDGSEGPGIFADFAVDTVTKVIGSAQADTHQLTSKPKEYVLGSGDNIIPAQPLARLAGLIPDIFTRDLGVVGETTIRFNGAGVGDGVSLDLFAGMLSFAADAAKPTDLELADVTSNGGTLRSASGSLPTLVKDDYIEVTGFGGSENNGVYKIVSVVTDQQEYEVVKIDASYSGREAAGITLTEESLSTEAQVVKLSQVLSPLNFLSVTSVDNGSLQNVNGNIADLVSSAPLLGVDLPTWTVGDYFVASGFSNANNNGVYKVLEVKDVNDRYRVEKLDGADLVAESVTQVNIQQTGTDSFAYRIYSGVGDDHFTGSSLADTFVFAGNWGKDTLDLRQPQAKGVVDTLDFSGALGTVIAEWEGNDLVFKQGTQNEVRILEARGLAAGVYAALPDSIAIPTAPDLPAGAGSVLLLASQPSAIMDIDLAAIENLVAHALQRFDGTTLTLNSATDPSTLAVQTVVNSEGVSVTQLVTVTDTGEVLDVLFDSSTLVISVANLAGTELSSRSDTGDITIDTTAADHGWYADAADPAADETGVDLLSVLVYEVGLKLGLDTSLDVMNPVIAAGDRPVLPADLGIQGDTSTISLDALQADGLPAGAITIADDFSAILNEAIGRWASAAIEVGGAPIADPTAVLAGVVITVDDLDGDALARTLDDGSIVLDYTAAGNGWFFDTALFDDAEFEVTANGLTAIDTGDAAGRVDMLTAIMHELGHQLGATHDGTAGALMSPDLGAGERRGIPGGVISLADLDYGDQQTLSDGLAAFAGWSVGLGERLDSYLNAVNVPFTDKSIPDLLGITTSGAELIAAATAGLQTAVAGVLDGSDRSAADILAIDGSTGTDYTFTITKAANNNPNSFVATINLLPNGVQTIDFDLASLMLGDEDLGFNVSGDLQLTVTSDLQLKVEFGLDRDDEFYVRAPELTAEVDVTSGSAGFNPSVTLGPIGLSVENGRVELQASASLAVDEFINLAGLAGAAAIDTALITPESNAKFAIDLPIAVSGGLSGAETDEVAIRASGILPTGTGDLASFLQGMNIQFENFDQLFQLRGISLADLLSGIVTVIDTLIGTNQDGLLYKIIPGINQSVADILSEQLDLNGADLLGTIKTEIVKVQEEQSLTGAQDALNSFFNDLFDDVIDPVTIRLEDSILILDLEFEKLIAGFDQTFDLNLATFADELGLTALIGAANVETITDKLKIGGDPDLSLFADILVGFNIGVGLDLRNVFDPEQIISSDTGIFVQLDAGLVDPLTFNVELDVSDIDLGSVLNIAGFDASSLPKLDTVGFGIKDATADLDFLLEFGLPDTPEGFYDIDTVPAAEIRASGQAAVDLPLVIGNFPIGGSDEDLNGDGFNDNVLHVGATFADGDFDFEFASPGMDQLISLAGFLNDPQNIVKGLDKIFEVIESKLAGELRKLDLPLIGGALNQAEGFFDDGIDGSGDDLREKVVGKLEQLIAANPDATTIDLVAQALIEGLNEFLPADAADALGVTLGGDFVEFNLELAGDLFHKEVDIDLGLPDAFADLLTFTSNGSILIDMGYAFAFGFGFSIEDGFYLNTDGATDGGEEFLLDLSATMNGTDITGALPILTVNIRDLTGDTKDNDDLPSGIFGAFSIDLQDADKNGRLSIGEAATVEARLVAEANADLELTVAVGPANSPLFPTITTTFRYDQVLADIGTSGSTIAATPIVVFENVELDLGQFISTFVQPIVDVVEDAVAPLTPIVDFLNEPIEVIMDLLGTDDPITLLTIAEDLVASGLISGDAAKKIATATTFANGLSDIVTLVNNVTNYVENAGTDPLVINFGTFTVLGDDDAEAEPAPVDVAAQAGAGGDATAGDLVTSFSGGGFEFPILTNPASIFGLLLGNEVELFTYQVPKLDFGFDYSQSFPIFPGLNAKLTGKVNATADISFGFDTSGFNDWKAGGFVTAEIPLIFNGLYLSDNWIIEADGSITDNPEATLFAEIRAGAFVGIGGLIEAGVDGGIIGTINFDLNDIPKPFTGPGTEEPAVYDGKLRADELLQRLEQTHELVPGSGVEIPCVFDINGEVRFGLDAFFWVGLDLGFFGKVTVFEARETFLSGLLASFDFECPDPIQSSLADFDESTGEVSIKSELADGAFKLSRQTLENSQGDPTEYLVISTGSSFDRVEFADVKAIVFTGTEDADQFVLGAGFDDIAIYVDGRGGNDRIALASGGGAATNVVILGGKGEDEIVVAETALGNLDIDGGDDDDNIMVSSGDTNTNTILIHGGSGNDRIVGSDRADTIYGDGGRDVILGMDGADIIYGGDIDQAAFDAEVAAALADSKLPPFIDDLIYGGDGSDEIYGGSGNDRLLGEVGNDKLYGQDGDDMLVGGLDVDELSGGADRDTIVWSYGDGEDALWDGGDGFTLESDKFADTVQISGVKFAEDGSTIAVGDTVTLSRAGATDDVNVTWEQAGSPNAFKLTNIERISIDLGSGSDVLTINDLDQTTVKSIEANLGTSESITTTTSADGDEFLVRNVVSDSDVDVINLNGSSGKDIFEIESTSTVIEGAPTRNGLLIQQSKGTLVSRQDILTLSVFNPVQANDRLNIDTGADDDVIDASAVSLNVLTAIGMTAGSENDIVIGSPFIDDIDSGSGNDQVTGGAGVDLFTDASGDDKLLEARDVNFTLSDATLITATLDSGLNPDQQFTQPDGSTKVIRQEFISETEILSGIFEEVYLTGYNLSEGNDGVASVNIFNVSDFTGDAFLNGGAASDIYNIQLSGGAAATFTSFIDIIDGGGPENAGIDVLNLEGTNEADTFRFDKDVVERLSGGSDALFTRAENYSTDIDVRNKSELPAGVSVQTVNYLTTEDMVVHGRGGDDLFIVDDSSTELFVYGDSGDDNFFIGSVTAVTSFPNPKGGDPIQVVDRTAANGGVTNGVSFPAEFHGGKGNDYFEVNHNIAEIFLYGEDGDDIFFLKALLTTEPVDSDGDGIPDDEYTPQEDINVFSAIGESDTLAYVKNAPVNIFGGEGFDTLVIVGTVIDDTFVIFTEFDEQLGRDVQRIFGAGLVVPTIDSIERIQIITGAGDDTVYLYGTLDDQEILINTGTGNDIVQIGGDELNFDVTIPESKYTKIERIPQPDIVTTDTITIPSKTWWTLSYRSFFGFGPAWIPTWVRNFVPANTFEVRRSTPQAPLELPTVVTVPEFNLAITVPETRNLTNISGPVFINGVIADGGNDSIVIDNRYGDESDPGTLQKNTVESVDINIGTGEEDIAKEILSTSLPGGVDVNVVYKSVVSYLEDQNRIRQQGLINGMLDDDSPVATTSISLRDGQRIQAFESGNVLASLLGYLPATSGSYKDIDSETGAEITTSFNFTDLSSAGNDFLPDDVFFVEGSSLGLLEVELLYDVNGGLIGTNVFAEEGLSFSVDNDFVQSSVLDADNTRTYDALSGFGLGIGVFYENFTLVDLQLSNGNDVLTIEDTTATAVTNVFGGGGDDRIEVDNTSGTLNIFGDVAGTDTNGLGIPSNVAGTYAEDFRDTDNAEALRTLLGLSANFDATSISDIKVLATELNTTFGAGINVVGIADVINLDTDDYTAQIWELLKAELNVLQGDSSDYRDFLGGTGEYATFASDLGNFVGLGVEFDPINRSHLAALAGKVNAENYSLTVNIGLAGSINSLRRDLDVFSGFVSELLGPINLDILDGAEVADYRSAAALAAMGVKFELGGDFDLNNRSHLQLLASLVNKEKFRTTVAIDVNGSVDELSASLDTLDRFVWQTLKADLKRASNGTAYNPLPDNGLPLKYRDHFAALGSILNVGTFDPADVADVKALATRLNADFNDLGIDVGGIALEPNINLDDYRLEIWTLIADAGLVDVPSGNDTFNIYKTGAEVVIRGQDGIDTVNLNNASLGAWLTALGQQGDDDFNVYNLSDLTTESNRGDGRGEISDSVDFDGGSGLDEYYVDLTGGSTDYRINVLDTGVGGEDTLTIEGTSAADTFLMRRVTELPGYTADSPAFVALLHGTIEEILANESTRPDTYERINYDANIDGFLRVNGLAGDDYFASDDNSTTTILDGGADKDTFQIGQIYRTARVDGSVNPEDAFSTIQTTRGYLSRGVSYETQIIGGTEDDRIVVYSNAAELTLEGNGGNDSFEVRAFELAGGGFSTDSVTDINTGDGDDTVQYNVNAPVNIDGGTGFDTIVVLGTESNDNFVVTAGAIYGAGLFVSYSGAESIQIDGLEGDDTFFILSTAANVLTTVIGGLGSDTFNVGGDVTEAITSVGWDEGDNVQQRTLTDILGPLVIEGHYLEGANRSLSAPVMLPGESSEAIADGDVLGFLGTGESSALDVMQVATTAVAAGLNRENGSSDLQDLIGLTLEITDGSGEGRFWSIQGVTDNLDGTVQLSLRNPSVLESAGIADIGVPDTSSSFAVSQLNPSFFANEAEQVDTLNVFNDGSVVDDTGTLAAIDVNNSLVTLEAALNLSGLGMGTGFVADLGTTDTGDDITFAGGITIDDLEILEILLGQGNDDLTIEDTLRNPENHGGITIVHGGGNTLTGTGEMGGDTITINGGGGADSPLVVYGDTSQDGSRYAGTQDATPETLANSFSNAGNDTIDARNASETVTLYGGAGDDEIWGGSAGDNLAGGSGNDEIHGQGGTDLIYGDSGINVNSLTRLMTVPTVDESTNPNKDDLAVGNDTLHGDGGEDVIFGDHGIVTRADPAAALWTTSLASITGLQSDIVDEGGKDTVYGGDNADFIFGGSNTTTGGDMLYGDAGDDLIFGDHGAVTLNGNVTNIESTVTAVGGGDDTLEGGTESDILIGGSNTSDGTSRGGDTILGQAGEDVIFGDYGNITLVNPTNDILTTEHTSIGYLESSGVEDGGDDTVSGGIGSDVIFGGSNTVNGIAKGGDTLYGDAGEDLIFGDHGIISLVEPSLTPWATIHEAINRIESSERSQGGDDIMFGGNEADILIGGANTLNGTRGGDAIDGGTGDDLIFGDNVALDHRAAGTGGRTADPRLRTLDGAEIYVTGGPDDGEVAPSSSVTSGHPQVTATWAEYEITDLDHSAGIEAAGDRNFGDDYIAGGADDDTIFGQLGDDVIQGDGSIGNGIDDRVGASRDPSSGVLLLDPSVEAATDGDDYIEGNGGNDVIFGNLGQDDIVGGSSSLFTLVDADLRPDGSDMLFGGSGQRVERNYQVPVGDDANSDTIVLGSLHAEDSDVIAGDNANIYRLVGTNGNDTGAFLNFQYDAGRGAESIIVRAVDLIDYTPGGSDYDPVNAQSDIGAGDEIHGGSGDDFIYGMKGSDLLFGDSEDDDLIGGYGNDWISGGAGSDGVLGDDGRIYTSRNEQGDPATFAEALYGISKLAQTDLEISTPGNAQQAIINVSGALKKTANLTPFNVDPLEDNLYRAQDADDIIFGGLGNDFLHGGSGDDAISGAEAIASGFAVSYPDDGTSDANRTDGIVISFGFDNPMNPGNILGYSGLRAGEFAAYDEFNPRHRIVSETGEEYFLNFNASEGEEVEAGIFSDGNDVIFGDLGNDWVVGGTGQDNMYGGRGDDLLNADDDHGTNGGLNDVTDTSDSYADRAFGGAGRDVLIANTGVDRLIDWAGEFNTYLVPFSPFGPPTISRALPPRLFDFLYDLSASDGADPTRAADEGSDGARNGEPFGELGLIIQKDFGWQDQTGAPDDPQPGNIPGGSRDVVRQATFNQGTAESFLPDVGDWSVSGSRLQVSPETLGGDAVSVYYADVVLPTYFEMQATIQGGKPTAGLKSNAYLIFDYQSPTDFKFAGVNVSTDKLEMGHRDESGWHIDVSTNAKLRPNTDYNLLLALNGTAATLVVNNKDVLNFAFEARVDPDGYSYGFNSGMVGIGAFNSVASIDNVKLQVLPRDVEMIRQSDFDSGPVDFLTGDSVGQWQIANGYLVGDGSVGGLSTAWGGQIAYTTSDVRIAAEQVVEIEATLEAGATGGIVFDQYGETDFKFVYIDESGVVSIGHQTGQRWDIEASAQMPNQVKGDYDIRVALVGTTVSVIIDNQTVVSYAYNALTGDGAIGLLAAGSNARFDNVSISTNDSAYLDANTGDALRAAGDAASTPGITLEDGVNLQPLLDASVERWSSWLGETLPGANGLSIWITDLPDELLGLTVGDVIYVDSDAAGRGWFVDETPKYDNEFDATGNALAGTDAANGIDLLSVIAHEVGHVLGYDHDTLQTSTLSVGTRLVPEIRDAGDEPLHRNAEISSDLLNSLIDVSKRIVPVNLGMFGAMHRQIPWAFPDDASLADSDLHAMMWNEEAGEFETAKPVKPARIADDRPGILEFLEETGDWNR